MTIPVHITKADTGRRMYAGNLRTFWATEYFTGWTIYTSNIGAVGLLNGRIVNQETPLTEGDAARFLVMLAAVLST